VFALGVAVALVCMPATTVSPALFPCKPEAPYLLAIPPSARKAIAWILVTLFACTYYALPTMVIGSVVLGTIGYVRTAAALAMALIIGASWPMREWPGARSFCQIFYEIFHVRHNLTDARIAKIVESSVEGGERYILGMHPHGVVPIQCLLWAAYADQYLRTSKHGTVYGFGGMASVILYLPILRQLLGWLSAVSATYSNLKRLLTTGTSHKTFRGRHPGRNLYMLPGGLAEIFTASPGAHAIVWKARRGLCRLALETGARLVPVYVFGGNDFFHQSLTSDSWLSRKSRELGCSITIFWGRWFLPIPLVPQPGVSIILADPLPSRRTTAADGRPTDDEVDALNREYEATIRALFDKYKGAAGYADAQLVVT
jgi:hypothetical protein